MTIWARPTKPEPRTATALDVLRYFAPYLHPFGPGGGFGDEAGQILWEDMHQRMLELLCPDHDPNGGPGSDQCPTCKRYAWNYR